MINSKLIALLQSLSPKEWDRFSVFLTSPYCCVNPLPGRLLGLLKKFRPAFDNKHLTKNFLHRQLFGGKYSDKKIRYLMTELTQLAEMFLAVQRLLKDDHLYNTSLLHELSARKLGKSFHTQFRKAETQQNRQPCRDAEHQARMFDLQLKKLNHEAITQSRSQTGNIMNVLEQLDHFYLSKKLQLSSEVINLSNITAQQHDVFMLDETLAQLETHPYGQLPAIEVYRQIIFTLRYPDNEEHFEELEKTLKRQRERFTKAELRDMYQYVLNYCIRKINTGHIAYQQKLFNTYKYLLHQSILLPNNQLSQFDYKNIVTIALRNGELKWTEKFIEDYRQFLPAAQRENAYTYNLANLNFYRKDFKAALRLLQKVDYTDVFYKLDSRSMLLKTYYELDEDEAFFSHASAFRLLLRRDKRLSAYQRTIYINLIRFTAKLLRTKGSKRKVKRVQQLMNATPQIADSQWLQAKMAELL